MIISCWRCEGDQHVRGWTVGKPESKFVECPDCLGTGLPVKVCYTFAPEIDLDWTEKKAS